MNFKVKRIIDLSQPIFDNCPGNPAFSACRIKQIMSYDKEGWNAECLEIATHIGSHIDAPIHHLPNGISIDKIPLHRFQGYAVPINLYYKKPEQGIFVSDIISYDKKIKKGEMVLLATGWGEKRANSDEYLYKSPWLSKEAAEWLVNKGVNGVGIDHFSIGSANPKYVEAPHDVLMKAEILILEDLYLPRTLFELEKWYLVAFPLNLLEASGSLVRTVAMEIE